jgi:hypothetical protein
MDSIDLGYFIKRSRTLEETGRIETGNIGEEAKFARTNARSKPREAITPYTWDGASSGPPNIGFA